MITMLDVCSITPLIFVPVSQSHTPKFRTEIKIVPCIVSFKEFKMHGVEVVDIPMIMEEVFQQLS